MKKRFSAARLGQYVYNGRKKKNISQIELGREAGISRNRIGLIEKGVRIPTILELEKLGDVLDFDISELFERKTVTSPKPSLFNCKYHVTIIGTGYASLSLAVMLAADNEVTILNTGTQKEEIQRWLTTTIQEEALHNYLEKVQLHVKIADDHREAFHNADYVVITDELDYRFNKNTFDDAPIESVIELVREASPDAAIVISSFVPVGYIRFLRRTYHTNNIIYSPLFLRETHPLYDCLYPSRIIVSTDRETCSKSEIYALMLKYGALTENIEPLLIGPGEAEAVTLYSNYFQMLCLTFFNELDTHSAANFLNSKEIFSGLLQDPQVGRFILNPNFGSLSSPLHEKNKHLSVNNCDYPLYMLRAILESDRARKGFITDQLLEKAGYEEDFCSSKRTEQKKGGIIGVFRLTEKNNIDSIQDSPVPDVVKELKANGANVIIYEPNLPDGSTYLGCEVMNDLKRFKRRSQVIAACRYDHRLDEVKDKVYTRDLAFAG